MKQSPWVRQIRHCLQASCLVWLWLPGTAHADERRNRYLHHHHQTESAASLRAQREAARAALRAHREASALAAAHRREIAAKAAALAQQQATAASALRGLEDQTAQDSATLAQLQRQQDQVAARLTAAEAALQKLLPIIQRLATAPATTLLVAPLSPQESVQSIGILQGLTAELGQEAAVIKVQTAALTTSIAQIQAARAKLDQAVAIQQAAEAKLNQDIVQARQDELADIDTEAAEAAEAARAQHQLTSLDAAIARLVPKAPPHPPPLQPGSAGAPVAGQIILTYGAPTPAGPSTGISYATAPDASVTSPCTGTILYAGPLTGYGTVVIAGCGGGLAAVLAGMSHLDVSQGQRVLHGQPLGNMQGFNPLSPAYQPHLYVELRQNGAAIDPAPWLGAKHSG